MARESVTAVLRLVGALAALAVGASAAKEFVTINVACTPGQGPGSCSEQTCFTVPTEQCLLLPVTELPVSFSCTDNLTVATVNLWTAPGNCSGFDVTMPFSSGVCQSMRVAWVSLTCFRRPTDNAQPLSEAPRAVQRALAGLASSLRKRTSRGDRAPSA